jgi:diadenosine hexaphosphate hydrolase (ATP-forming)
VHKEVSAGGLVARGGKVLLVKVENLQGEVRWTFPKGHLEAGEDAPEAALREVEEETGWACRIEAPLTTARYRFRHDGREVAKEVRWFLMAPLRKTGSRDPVEVMAVRWASLEAARRLISYPSDIELFEAFLLRRGA